MQGLFANVLMQVPAGCRHSCRRVRQGAACAWQHTCKFGRQAALTMAGGPQMPANVVGPAGNRCSRIMSSLMYPVPYFQSSPSFGRDTASWQRQYHCPSAKMG